MMKITIVAISSIKEKYFKQACEEYLKRLSAYCEIQITEIQSVKLSEKPSEKEIWAALKKEAALIKKKLPSGSFKIAACIEGKPLSSEKFAQLIEQCQTENGKLTFIIGGSYGLDEEIKALADLKLSLSQMTFPHRLFRVMLLEQIYRGFKIKEGSAYHK